MDTTNYNLIVFDLDGTLAEFKTGVILPGVREWFDEWRTLSHDERPRLALASNQGGVGLRHWMESDGFGNPSNYPTQQQIAEHVAKVMQNIGLRERDMMNYMCFTYQSKRSGMWAPIPHDIAMSGNPRLINRWRDTHRKPNPGCCLMQWQTPELFLVAR
jgi:phosphoglycolate phosphatase-like HAD superfamily hydrolase